MSSLDDKVAAAVAASKPEKVETPPSKLQSARRKGPVVIITDLEALGEFCGWPGLFSSD